MRRFEFSEGSSNKFWEVSVEGSAQTIRYGKLGTEGRTQVKTFASHEAALADTAKLVQEKTKKGYVEAGSVQEAQRQESAPVAPPKQPALVTKATTVPRSGTWRSLVAPGGGRAYLGLPFLRWWASSGTFKLACTNEGELYRVDMSAGRAERLGAFPIDARGYVSLAIDSQGLHWAVTSQTGTWLDGKPLEPRVDTLSFTSEGLLLGYHKQEILKIDPSSREVVWRGGQRSSALAEGGGWLVTASGYGVDIIGSDGQRQSIDTEDQGHVFALHLQGGKAYVFAGPQSICRVLVFDLTARTHEVIEQRLPSDVTMTRDGRIVWLEGELNPATREVTTYEVSSLQSDHMAIMEAAGLTLSPDETELWQLHQRSSSVRRLLRSTREELNAPTPPSEGFIWHLDVAPDGRVAIAHDHVWRLLSAAGETLFRADGIGQLYGLALSPSGDRVAVTECNAEGETLVRVVSTESFKTLVERKLSVGEELVFSPEGDRLIVGGEFPLLCSAETLASQYALGVRELRGIHWSDGRIVGHDTDGRAYVFDDPGPGPAVKKPEKLKPAVKLARAEVVGSNGQPRVELLGDQAVVFTHTHRALFDLAKGKKVSSQPARGFGTRSGKVYFVEEPEGVSLWRQGENEPFARLPQHVDHIGASADARHVVATFHDGVMLWSGEGEQVAEASPLTATQSQELPGFTADSIALAITGVVATLPMHAAHALAKSIALQALQRGIENLVAVPAGDLSETTGFKADDAVEMIVGIEVARAEPDAEQGTPGTAVALEARAVERALQAWQKVKAEVLGWVEGKAKVEADEGLHVVAAGPLCSFHLKGRVRVHGEESNGFSASWDGADAWATVVLLGAKAALTATYD